MTEYISFPNIGWTLPLSDTLFSIGGFSVKWYGLLIAIGFLLAVVYAYRNIDRFGLKIDPLMDVVLVCAVFAFVGARLYYVLFSDRRDEYFADPLSILEVWNGGIAIYGAVIGAFVTALWMCPLRKVDTLRAFDIAAPGFLIGQAIGRWGNFFNQEAFGGNTDLPWGMTGSWIQNTSNGVTGYDHSLPVHPTFLYESLWCALGLLVIHIVSKKAYKFKGQLFTMYIMWYGAGRFFIEMLRTDSLYLGSMRVSCLVALLCVLGGAVLFLVFRAASHASPKDLFAEETLAVSEEIETVVTAEETVAVDENEEDVHVSEED